MDEIIAICNQLAEAVMVIHNPNSEPQLRTEAYNVCETFKDTSPIGTECAFCLLQHCSDLVRHFGLQLIEHRIKYKWYEISPDERTSIKEKTLRLIDGQQQSHELIANYPHVKDVLTRIMVEMMKREWPQCWPMLFPQLFDTATKDPIRAELVLLILLRLNEDVAVLQTCPSIQRKKEICQALTTEFDNIQKFLLNIMELYYVQAATHNSEESVRIVRLGLVVLSELIEWVPLNRLLVNIERIFDVLATVMPNKCYLLEAADCSAQILRRKGKFDEMNVLAQKFFNSCVINQCALTDTLSNFSDNSNSIRNDDYEERYKIVMKMSELLLSVSQFLFLLTDKCDQRERILQPLVNNNSEKFELYLKMLTSMIKHNSLRVLYNVIIAWKDLFRSKYFNEVLPLGTYVSDWIDCFAPRLIHVPYNSSAAASSIDKTDRFLAISEYIAYEFDSEEEYSKFYHRFRTELLLAYRYVISLGPALVYSFLDKFITNCIEKTLSSSRVVTVRQYWEPVIILAEPTFTYFPTWYKPPLDDGLRLLDLCLKTDVPDPVIMSNLLTCLSNLMFFVKQSPSETRSSYLVRIIDRTMSALIFPFPPTADPNQVGGAIDKSSFKEVRTLRRHAGSLLIKISRLYPDLMSTFFDYLCGCYNKFQLGRMEQILMLEALILLCNHAKNYQQQRDFVETIISDVRTYWEQAVPEIVESVPKFLDYVGLDQNTIDAGLRADHDWFQTKRENQAKLMHAVDMLNAVFMRSAFPADKDDCIRGGFVLKSKADGTPIYNNPCASFAVASLTSVCSLARILNCLWDHSISPTLLPAVYANILDISESERKSLVETVCLDRLDDFVYANLNGGTADNNNVMTMMMTPTDHRYLVGVQNYMTLLYEKTMLTVMRIIRCSPYDIFDHPQFVVNLSQSVFRNLDCVPDFRLKIIVQHPLKAIVTFCPVEYQDSIAIPFLEYFAEYMYHRLKARWRYVEQNKPEMDNDEPTATDDDTKIAQDLLDYLIVQKLTKEYMNVVKTLLIIIPPSSSSDSTSAADIVVDSNMDESNDVANDHQHNSNSNNNNKSNSRFECLSNFGLKILRNHGVFLWIVRFLSDATSWEDSDASLKATSLLMLIMKQMIVDNLIVPQVASDFLITFLRGIHAHGQHESNLGVLLGAAVSLYDSLRVGCPNLLEIMKQIPNINEAELYKFDEQILKQTNQQQQQGSGGGKVDKGKREKFKKLVGPIIGLHLNQLYKRQPLIRDLPRFDAFQIIKKETVLSASSQTAGAPDLGVIGQLLS